MNGPGGDPGTTHRPGLPTPAAQPIRLAPCHPAGARALTLLAAVMICACAPQGPPAGPAQPQTATGQGLSAAPGDLGWGDLESDVLTHLNLARTDPAAYAAAFIAPRRALFEGLVYRNPLDPLRLAVLTREGTGALDEALDTLAATPDMGPLAPSPALIRAAADHARDQSRSGATGHRGSDGTSVAERVARYGSWQTSIGEVIAYGFGTGPEVISQLLIDDGISSRGHRTNLLRPQFRRVGIAAAPHPNLRHVVVITLAGSVTEGGPR